MLRNPPLALHRTLAVHMAMLPHQDFQLGLDLQEAKVNELLANQTAQEAERAGRRQPVATSVGVLFAFSL